MAKKLFSDPHRRQRFRRQRLRGHTTSSGFETGGGPTEDQRLRRAVDAARSRHHNQYFEFMFF
eukprot:2879723-Pyramimonas_sp.AAC.1